LPTFGRPTITTVGVDDTISILADLRRKLAFFTFAVRR
jgi:hypothetical protein